jgi:hypothetical protein
MGCGSWSGPVRVNPILASSLVARFGRVDCCHFPNCSLTTEYVGGANVAASRSLDRSALKYKEGHYGVRLSFALSSWLELANSYPPAMNAYRKVLERSSSRLLDGKDRWDLFHDVVSMNERIDRNADSLELFRRLMEINPKLGDSYVMGMMGLLLNDGDFETCLRFSDPEGTTEFCLGIGYTNAFTKRWRTRGRTSKGEQRSENKRAYSCSRNEHVRRNASRACFST